MALKKTQNQLKKEFRQEIGELRLAILLKCGECMGFFLDPYELCTSTVCPLRKFYPKAGKIKSRAFKQKLIELAKALGNDTFIVSQIGQDEAE